MASDVMDWGRRLPWFGLFQTEMGHPNSLHKAVNGDSPTLKTFHTTG
jgi:hypothetical protein